MHIHFCVDELQAVVALVQSVQTSPTAWLRMCLAPISERVRRFAATA